MLQTLTPPIGLPLPRHPHSPRGAQAAVIKTFDGRPACDFSALHEAQFWLNARGFSFGLSCIGHPSGVMFGRWSVAKWRNMTSREIAALHGEISGDFRTGPVTVAIYTTAPVAAIEAAALPAFALVLSNHKLGVTP